MPVDAGICQGNFTVQGDLRVQGALPTYPRSSLALDTSQILALPLHIWRVWDAVATPLPGTSASDDLGYITGTFATAGSYIGTSDLKTAGATTRYARCLAVLPPYYAAGETVSVRFSAGMITHIADVSATLLVAAYEVARADRTLSSNLYSGAAVSINSLTFAETSFALTSAALTPGDMLDIRIAIAVNDAASATAVIAAINTVELLTSIRG